jgi:hypothetical protein
LIIQSVRTNYNYNILMIIIIQIYLLLFIYIIEQILFSVNRSFYNIQRIDEFIYEEKYLYMIIL